MVVKRAGAVLFTGVYSGRKIIVKHELPVDTLVFENYENL